ncbi:SDR family NAD(P)-dependent oxidoreductase [Acinetobacter baumannii]
MHKLNDRNELEVSKLFQNIKQQDQILDVVIHNIDVNIPSRFLRTRINFFKEMWQSAFISGFLIGQEATTIMSEQMYGSIIFTSTVTSLRNKAFFSAFTMGKSALNFYILNLAKNYKSKNIHISHVVIDGTVSDRINKVLIDLSRFVTGNSGIGVGGLTDAIAENYWRLHQQKDHLLVNEIELYLHKLKF